MGFCVCGYSIPISKLMTVINKYVVRDLYIFHFFKSVRGASLPQSGTMDYIADKTFFRTFFH